MKIISIRIINALIDVYRANPLRPHCGGGKHAALCRLIMPGYERYSGSQACGYEPLPATRHPGGRTCRD